MGAEVKFMIRRYIEFENYRTIGVTELGSEAQTLEISYTSASTNKVMGGLITLIGLNNSGKSNVLDGIVALKHGTRCSDKPNFTGISENTIGAIKWVYKNRYAGEEVKYDASTGDYLLEYDINTEKKVVNHNTSVGEYTSFGGFVNVSFWKEYEILHNDFKSLYENIEYNNELPEEMRTELFNSFSINGHGPGLKVFERGNEQRSTIKCDEAITRMHRSMRKLNKVKPVVSERTLRAFADLVRKYTIDKVSRNRIYYISDDKVKSILYDMINDDYDGLLWEIGGNVIGKLKFPDRYDYLQNEYYSDSDKDVLMLNGEEELIELLLNQDIKTLKRGMNSILYSRSEYKQIVKLNDEEIESLSRFEVFKLLDGESVNGEKLEYRAIKILENEMKISNLAKLPDIVKHKSDDGYKYNDLILDNITSVNIGHNINISRFFKKIFRLLEIDILEIEKVYINGEKNHIVREDFEKSCNKKLIEVSNTFNKLYFANVGEIYEFEIKLEVNRIKFIIKDCNMIVNLDEQSTGFKWFFNFFIDVLANTDLVEGDIVILDEPAANLHPQSQVELTNIIRNVGISRGITFIISTHSPFLVSLDHLDEVRVISKQGSITKISSKFNTINPKNALSPIVNSLFVEQFVLLDSARCKVFLEGVTDYNYLTAFKNILCDSRGNSFEKQFHFIPVNGLGGNKVTHMEKFKELGKSHPNSILLVDADEDGYIAYGNLKNGETGITPVRLNQIVDGAVEIEDLFVGEDRVHVQVKNGAYSANFKKSLMKDNNIVSEETKENFRKLLTMLPIS